MQYNIPELQPDPSTTVYSSISVLSTRRDLCAAQRMRMRMRGGTIALAMPSSQLQVTSSHRHSTWPFHQTFPGANIRVSSAKCPFAVAMATLSLCVPYSPLLSPSANIYVLSSEPVFSQLPDRLEIASLVHVQRPLKRIWEVLRGSNST